MSFPVRRTAHQVDELLDPDLRKIGASGRLWTRAEMVSALVGELSDGAGAIEATEMADAVVGPELVLLTYVSHWRGRTGQAQFAVAAVSRLMAADRRQGTPLEDV